MTTLWKKDPTTGAKIPRLVRRLTEDDLIVTLTPDGVMLREKGRRTQYGPLPYGWLKLRAAERMAEQRRAARAGARQIRRKVRRGVQV